MDLSVVLIARNEEANIARCLEALRPIYALGEMEVETILVDSASQDSTREIAAPRCDKVVALSASRPLSAALGRSVGTLEARGHWVLYLDSDMVLSPSWAKLLPRLITAPDYLGFTGDMTYVYPDGSTRRGAKRYSPNQRVVSHFGGAVLLARTTVLDVGNWNACLVANEEIDLYTRLRSAGSVVVRTDEEICIHYAKAPLGKSVAWASTLSSLRGTRAQSVGRLLAHRLLTKDAGSLVRYYPEPFIVFTSILVATLGVFSESFVLLATAFFGVAATGYRRHWLFPMYLILLIPATLSGFARTFVGHRCAGSEGIPGGPQTDRSPPPNRSRGSRGDLD